SLRGVSYWTGAGVGVATPGVAGVVPAAYRPSTESVECRRVPLSPSSLCVASAENRFFALRLLRSNDEPRRVARSKGRTAKADIYEGKEKKSFLRKFNHSPTCHHVCLPQKSEMPVHGLGYKSQAATKIVLGIQCSGCKTLDLFMTHFLQRIPRLIGSATVIFLLHPRCNRKLALLCIILPRSEVKAARSPTHCTRCLRWRICTVKGHGRSFIAAQCRSMPASCSAWWCVSETPRRSASIAAICVARHQSLERRRRRKRRTCDRRRSTESTELDISDR
ncbi:hypothetical protein ALC62_02210, partial [Cyphomyrmex costatus]